ncbi:fibronectin type III domain-containing protein [Candidatus Margulisiibacteriota bacterium]
MTLSWSLAEDPEEETVTHTIWIKGPEDSDFILYVPTRPTEHDLSELALGRYDWYVEASDGTNSVESLRAYFEIRGNIPPTAPVLTNPGPNAEGVLLDVTLNWTASTDEDSDTITYDVYVREEGQADWGLPVAVSLPDPEYNLTSLSAGTTYEWKVEANDGHGGIVPSSELSFTTISNPPDAPTNLQPENDFSATERAIALSWDGVEGEGITYQVYLMGPGDDTFVFQDEIELTTFDLSGLVPGEYEWYVRSNDGINVSESSEVRRFTVINNLPELEMTYPGADAEDIPLDITFNWKGEDVDGDALTYRIYIKAAGEEWGDPIAEGLPTTRYEATDFIFVPGQDYEWKVEAYDGYDTTVSEATFTTRNDPPTPPGLLFPGDGDRTRDTSLTLRWSPAVDPEEETVTHTIWIKGPGDTGYVSYVPTRPTEHDLSGLALGRYDWYVEASDGTNNIETASRYFEIHGNTPPIAPVLTSPGPDAVNVDRYNIEFDWNPSSDEDGDVSVYTLYLRKQGDLDWGEAIVEGWLDPDYDALGLSLDFGTEYEWMVRADDGHGGITDSALSSFTTRNDAPTTPGLLFPGDEYRTRNTSLTLSWNLSVDPEEETVTHTIWIKGPGDTDFISYTPTRPTEHDLSGLALGRYDWYVEATDGTTIVATASRYFEIYGNTPPTPPVLTSPGRNAVDEPLNATLAWTGSTDEDGDTITYDVYLREQGEGDFGEPVATSLTSTTFQPVSLLPGRTYVWEVRANDGQGGIVPSIQTFSFSTAHGLPPAPTNLQPENDFSTTERSISLSWDEVWGEGITYQVYLMGPGDEGFVYHGATGAISYSLNDLVPGEYEWYVRSAVDGINVSEASEIRNFTVINNSPELEMTYPGDAAIDIPLDITFNWNGQDADGDDLIYKIYIKEAEEEWGDPIAEGLTTTSYEATDFVFDPGQDYEWKVEAYDGYDTTVSEATFTTKNDPPTTPGLLFPGDEYRTRNTSLTLSWSPAVDPEEESVTHTIWIKGPGDPDFISYVPTRPTEHDLSGLALGRYDWYVEATDGTNSVESSTRAYFEIYANSVPSAPELVSPAEGAVNVDRDSILFDWNASTDPDGDELAYYIYLREQGDTSTGDMIAGDLTDTSFDATGLALSVGTVYEWIVTVRDGHGGIVNSSLSSFTTLFIPPDPPGNLQPIDNFSTQERSIVLTWDVVAGEGITYNVHLKFGDGDFVQIANTEDIFFNLNDLAPGEYYWFLQTYDGVNVSEETAHLHFTIEDTPIENRPPSAPELTAPAADEVDVPFETTTFTWNASEDLDGDALTYNIYIREQGAEWGDPIEEGLTELNYQADFLKGEMVYEWKVEVSDGEEIVPSEVLTFTTEDCGCYDATYAAGMQAYIEATSGDEYLSAVPTDGDGIPYFIRGQICRGMYLGENNPYDSETYTDVCDVRHSSPQAFVEDRALTYRCKTGKNLGAILTHHAFSYAGSWLPMTRVTGMLDLIASIGAMPALRWMPQDWAMPSENYYPMDQLADQEADIRSDCRILAAKPYYIAMMFAPEANGSWFGFGRSDLGNTPEVVAAGIDYVRDLCDEEGATNLIWIPSPTTWDPYACGTGSGEAACPVSTVLDYYPLPRPGDQHLVWLSIYNWGTSQPWSSWKTFDEVAGPTIDYIKGAYPEVFLGAAELGSSSSGGDKPAWITNTQQRMVEEGFCMSLDFNPHVPKETDWTLFRMAGGEEPIYMDDAPAQLVQSYSRGPQQFLTKPASRLFFNILQEKSSKEYRMGLPVIQLP